MSTITQQIVGTFCWPELATTDDVGARRFYLPLFGWDEDTQDIGGGETYTMLKLHGGDVGALHRMREDVRKSGVPSHWLSYVAVANADETAAKAKALGGKVLAEPFDVMDAGRMAVLQDPAGATFAIWQGKRHIGISVRGEPGALCWTELLTIDTERSKAFYGQLFGWKAEPFPGPVPYTVFKTGDTQVGGMMAITPQMGPMPPNWTVYWEVSDCDATIAKAKSLGGTLCIDPMDIPGVGRMAMLMDPQGAAFAVIKTVPM
jgi:predicted enzyme related to lactoylglutathione lyase